MIGAGHDACSIPPPASEASGGEGGERSEPGGGCSSNQRSVIGNQTQIEIMITDSWSLIPVRPPPLTPPRHSLREWGEGNLRAVRHSAFFFGAVAFLMVVCCLHAHAAEIPQNERRSGTAFMSRDTQAMQEDDRANPGMLAVLDGEVLWNEAPAGAKSCAGC